MVKAPAITLFRAFGFTRGKILGSQGRQSGPKAPWASTVQAPPSTNWLVHLPGTLVDDGGNVLSVSDSLLDCRFNDQTFLVKDMAQSPLADIAAQAFDLLPTREREKNSEKLTGNETADALNEKFGEDFFFIKTIKRQGAMTFIGREEDNCYSPAFDSYVMRPFLRGKTGNPTHCCAFCLRNPRDKSDLIVSFTEKKQASNTAKVAPKPKRFCKLCLLRFKGKIPVAFAMTRDHFKKGRILKAPAAKKLMRTGPQAITLSDMMASLFDNDIRDLVGHTYRPRITDREQRIWCGMLCMAMPIGVFFCDGSASRKAELNTKYKLLAAIFREEPERGVALWNLEHHLASQWKHQQWTRMSAAGRLPIEGSDTKLKKMRADELFFKLDEAKVWGSMELLLWIDKEQAPFATSTSTTFPFMMPRTTVAMMYLWLIEQRVSIKIVLDSASRPPRNAASNLSCLDLTHNMTLNGNILRLSKCELLSLDLLFWIINRPCILGKIDMLDIELRGNYSRAVKNTTGNAVYRYELGHAFADLVDYAVRERIESIKPYMLQLEVDPEYTPASEYGEEELCAELETRAIADLSNDYAERKAQVRWPPALPFVRNPVNVAFEDMVNIVKHHARKLDTVWPSACNTFASELELD